MWETGEPFASNFSRNDWSALRKTLDKSNCFLNFCHESIPEPGRSEVVVLNIFSEVCVSALVEMRSHF